AAGVQFAAQRVELGVAQPRPRNGLIHLCRSRRPGIRQHQLARPLAEELLEDGFRILEVAARILELALRLEHAAVQARLLAERVASLSGAGHDLVAHATDLAEVVDGYAHR